MLGTTRNFSTPVRASRSSLLSLLADFTPNTHTWSRLKAALSVHRKGLGNTQTTLIYIQLFRSANHIQHFNDVISHPCFHHQCSSFCVPYPLFSSVLHTPRSSSPTNISRTDLVDFSQDLFATPFRPSLPKRLPSQLLSSSSLVQNT